MYAVKVDYGFPVLTPPPQEYPSDPVPDACAPEPFVPEYAARGRAFLDHIGQNPAPANLKAPYATTTPTPRLPFRPEHLTHGSMDTRWT